jgi:hypothetical protein
MHASSQSTLSHASFFEPLRFEWNRPVHRFYKKPAGLPGF